LARRPVFVPQSEIPLVRTLDPDFEWFPGFAVSQQQKSIASLHAAAGKLGVKRPLEISSKSSEELGRRLSAFNLLVRHPTAGEVPLESAFQAAKVFGRGGPYRELATVNPRDAKGDPRLRTSGLLIRFEWDGRRYPNRPTTAFYDWLYLQGLSLLDQDTLRQIAERDGFTDIAFNPQKSLNCQARSAALYASLVLHGHGSPWTLAFDELVALAY
jgi:hypothetical protein